MKMILWIFNKIMKTVHDILVVNVKQRLEDVEFTFYRQYSKYSKYYSSFMNDIFLLCINLSKELLASVQDINVYIEDLDIKKISDNEKKILTKKIYKIQKQFLDYDSKINDIVKKMHESDQDVRSAYCAFVSEVIREVGVLSGAIEVFLYYLSKEVEGN